MSCSYGGTLAAGRRARCVHRGTACTHFGHPSSHVHDPYTLAVVCWTCVSSRSLRAGSRLYNCMWRVQGALRRALERAHKFHHARLPAATLLNSFHASNQIPNSPDAACMSGVAQQVHVHPRLQARRARLTAAECCVSSPPALTVG